jgi:muramoyltetrapeptide carboxypeptidase
LTPLLKSIKKGDAIGIIAPASPVTDDEISSAVRIIEEEGYMVIKGGHLYDKNGYLAGRDEDRLTDLHDMFLNSDVKAVLCARGGYGTTRLLSSIDFDIIRKHPKPFAGYSDITALLLSIYKMTGMNVWHGPMLRAIKGREKYLKSLLKQMATGGSIDYRLAPDNVLKKGRARGRLLGGNLSMICAMIGTTYLPSFEGSIFFIEERGEPLYRIDRMLTQLRLSGVLKGIKGIIAGNFQECGEAHRVDELILENFSYEYPVYRGFPVGHGNRNRPVPMGAEAEMDTESLIFRVDAFMDKG